MRVAGHRGLAAMALIAFAGLVAIASATDAYAHARVVATSPGDGQTVTGDIARVWIRFDEAVSLLPRALTVTTDVGVPVALESPRLTNKGTMLVAVVQDHLAPGRYAVGWRVQADDGHTESSSFTFTVAAGGAHAAAPVSSGPPPPAPGEPLWPVFVAIGIAAAGGIGAGVAVRRGLRVAGAPATYPAPPPAAEPVNGPASANHGSLRLPM